MKTEDNPIIVEQVYNQPINKVWKTITNVAEMRHWFFDNIPDFKPEEGFYTEFNVSTGERNFYHQWEIIEVEPVKKIVYDWSYAEYPGKGTVTFELIETDNKTKLIVVSHGMSSFPQDIPEFKRESCAAGWNYFIKQSLKNYLESKE